MLNTSELSGGQMSPYSLLRPVGEPSQNSTSSGNFWFYIAALWLFIGLVSAYDTYLMVKYQDFLLQNELNPVGQWLLRQDNGNVATFLGLKFAGTVIVLGVLLLLSWYNRKLGAIVTSSLAFFQACLAMFLTFA